MTNVLQCTLNSAHFVFCTISSDYAAKMWSLYITGCIVLTLHVNVINKTWQYQQAITIISQWFRVTTSDCVSIWVFFVVLLVFSQHSKEGRNGMKTEENQSCLQQAPSATPYGEYSAYWTHNIQSFYYTCIIT